MKKVNLWLPVSWSRFPVSFNFVASLLIASIADCPPGNWYLVTGNC